MTSSAKDIDVHLGLDGVRKKPGPYLGVPDALGMLHCVKEAIDNSIDEALAGHNDTVGVALDKDFIYVYDKGRGIPVEKHPKTKLSCLTTVLSTLHAGGKMRDGKSGSYKASVGCFTGDTKIKLLNGKSATLSSLYNNFKKNEQSFWVYSFDEKSNTSFVPGKCYNVQLSKYVDELAVVYLDNGKKIRCTLDHPFMLINGKYEQASKLKPGQNLKALHTLIDKDGYETHNGGLGLNYKLQSEYKKGSKDFNHQVVKVEIKKLKKSVPVYGISVEPQHNYLLDAGVFVKNTHGMGISITNAMSEIFTAYTYRDGSWYSQTFTKGKVKTKVEKTKCPKLPTKIKIKKGTIIKFKLDTTVFDKGSTLPVDKLKQLLETSSYLNPKVHFYFDNGKEHKDYYQPKGILALTEKILKNNELDKMGKPFVFEEDGIHIVLQWSSNPDEISQSYVNGSFTVEGGTHVQGLQKAINESLKDFKNKKSKTVKPEHYRNGLISILNVNVASPRFDSQTKDKLITKEVTDYIYTKVVKSLTKFFKENKSLTKAIIKRAIEINEAHAQLQLSKKAAADLKINKKGKYILPTKLCAAINCKPEERELFIVEGDSAGGTAKAARNAKYQEVLKLKGKILNVFKDKKKQAFQSEEILDILKSIGFDPSQKDFKLRVGKIFLLMDPDPDGLHIIVLTLSVFQKYLPEVLDRGMVYVLKPCLFMTSHNGRRVFGDSLADLKKKVPSLDPEKVTRIKGLGEIGPDTLSELAFNPKTRKVMTISAVKGETLKYFESLVSENSDVRKALLNL